MSLDNLMTKTDLDDYTNEVKNYIANNSSDANVAQTATTNNSDYEVLFSSTADNTTRTEGARKNSNLKFNPSTGNLQTTQLNGVNIGSSPKFTDTTYESKSAVSDGTELSLVTTGEKHAWNNKSNFDGAYGSLSGKPTLGTAAAKDVASTGDASSSQVVLGNDSRLSDSRTPTAHNQASNTITAMTGYSKANSASAIAATDSLNTAIGKLEKALDGKGTSNLTIGTTSTTAAAGDHTHTAANVGAIATSARGAANGVAELDANGKIPLNRLPSYAESQSF